MISKERLKYCLILGVAISVLFVSCQPSEQSNLKYYLLSEEQPQYEQLILLLHGMNGNAEAWNGFADVVDDRTLLIAVEAPFETVADSYRWFDIEISSGSFDSDVQQMTASTLAVKSLINKLKVKYKIADGKVFMAGFSQGAIMSLNLGLTAPDVVDGVGVFSGMLPDSIENRVSSQILQLPIFITHGLYDQVIALSYAENARSYLISKGVNVKMTLENAGHEVTEKQFIDFIDWVNTL